MLLKEKQEEEEECHKQTKKKGSLQGCAHFRRIKKNEPQALTNRISRVCVCVFIVLLST